MNRFLALYHKIKINVILSYPRVNGESDKEYDDFLEYEARSRFLDIIDRYLRLYVR